MVLKSIKVYVTEEESQIINKKAKDSGLSTSKYIKLEVLKENRFINTKFINKLVIFSNDFNHILEKYDVEDNDLKKINEGVNSICQNL